MKRLLIGCALASAVACAGPALAQTPPSNMAAKTSVSGHGARAALEAAFLEARRLNLAVSIAVVDEGGELLAFQRMDAAPVGTIAVAQGKARTAARFKMPTGAISEMVNKAGLGMLTTPDMVALKGGSVIVHEGKVIGAIGVSGGNGDQDIQVGEAGLAKLK